MEKITSRDGTPVAYHRLGSGPPLVLVPGIGAANPVAWTAVTSRLAEHFTVVSVDRRGRGASGDSPAYDIEREFEDLAAIADSLPEPAYVLGHSFGATLALEATFYTQNISKLVLYEPSVPVPGEVHVPRGSLDELQAQLDAGDREGALVRFYLEVAGLAPWDVEGLKSSTAWNERLALAHTIPRELRADERHFLDPGRLHDLRIPVLLLLGSESPKYTKSGTEALNAALPDSRIALLPGQQHVAMYTAPDLFFQTVLDFLSGR